MKESFWRKPLTVGLAGVLVGVAGVFLVAGGIEATNTESFCISCHEMRENVYSEYKDSVHDTNRTGVRATCPDCHVPKALGPKLAVKIAASSELLGHFMGKIDTREKFEQHRYTMARSVWDKMRATDSRECRGCHNAEKMSPDVQSVTAQKKHATGKAEGLSCIDCHFGIAHNEPDGPNPIELRAQARRQ